MSPPRFPLDHQPADQGLRRSSRPRWGVGALVVALLAPGALLACEAVLGAGSGAGPDADNGPGAALPDGNSTALDRSTPCAVDEVPRSPVRRLSHAEFVNTLRDLLPVDPGVIELAAEEAIHGFENNERAMNPAPLLVEQRNDIAQRLAAKVMRSQKTRDELLGCGPDTEQSLCARSFVESFGKRVFRRPLTDEEVKQFVEFFSTMQGQIDFDAAAELTLQAFLQSPHFLYRLEFGTGAVDGKAVPLTDYELATRLSYTLWQSMPDQELLDAAEAHELTGSGYEAQVERMLASDRASQAFADFHRQWLHLGELAYQDKNPDQFPEWNDRLREDLHEESLRFVKELYASGNATQAALLTSTTAEVNADLAAYYGVADAPSEGWGLVELPAGERAGILTRGAFQAAHARPTNGSPPLRGVAVLEQFLCAKPPDPPPNIDTSLPAQEDGQPKTNRQLFESRTSVAGCQGCHLQIDGIGMAFEHYDSTGAFRAEDNGLPVDASGSLNNTDVDREYQDAIGMSEALAESRQVTACMMVNWYRYTMGRDELAGDWCRVDAMQEAAERGPEGLRDALHAVVTSYEFKHRRVIE